MIYMTKFRANDLNESRGKQIEFNSGVIEKFFKFKDPEHKVKFECYSLLDESYKSVIDVTLKLSPSRGDYKIYQNDDDSKTLKDVFLNDWGLTFEQNRDDYYAIKKASDNNYHLFLIPKDKLVSDFYTVVSKAVVFLDESQDDRDTNDLPLQKIVYGAPGTGKSCGTKGRIEDLGKKYKQTISESVVRTTFHPESDYSTFVGCYKPTMKKVQDKEEISYEFIPQAFTHAYIVAWKKYAEEREQFPNGEPQFLVIEEINRGNCAQIFGDLFQLLDRDDNGFSRYPIKADADLRKYLAKEFANEEKIPAKVRSGEELQLPPNLYIWATMNTSDQSLFPMDSAFKRRWDWEYVPITEGKNRDNGESLKWQIQVGGGDYDWWNFLKFTNEGVKSVTESDDKQLGYFFVKPKDGKISVNVFVNKVLFYLYNDVFKTYGLSEVYDKYPRFSDFFEVDTGKPSEEKVKALLDVIQEKESSTPETPQPAAE